MRFVDEAVIRVEAGRGGNGCLSFRRSANLPKGGPDGGDGGDGGDVCLVASSALHTLIDFRYQTHYRAVSGSDGGRQQKTGKSGQSLLIPVPVGTRVTVHSSGLLLGDLLTDGERLRVARGGRRGLGNLRFKTSVNRVPRRTTQGQAGEVILLALELMLMADVGLVGQPNAGKSSLIRKVSSARPKIADYPFTTRRPYLGVVRLNKGESFVMADIPGIIKDAAQGKGLGFQFLKHASRAGLLLHLVSLGAEDGLPLAQSATIVRKEMFAYSAEFSAKEHWLVFTKADLLPLEEAKKRVKEAIRLLDWGGRYYIISTINGTGIESLLNDLHLYLNQANSLEIEVCSGEPV